MRRKDAEPAAPARRGSRTSAGAVLGALLAAVLLAVPALGMSPGESLAREIRGVHLLPGSGVLRLRDRTISVKATVLLAGPSQSTGIVDIAVLARNLSHRPQTVAATDFTVSIDGDMFGLQRWDVRGSRASVASKHARMFHLRFAVPRGTGQTWALFYRPAHSRESGVIPLEGSRPLAPRVASGSSSQAPTIKTFWLTNGAGDPWGTAIDASGNIWFAEPGCDFAPTCNSSTPPGQIGELNPSSGSIKFYTLPNIAGNQPIFLAFDGSGKLWFTTPNNSRIGEFDPSSGAFAGQWPVTAGSGPWDLTFAGGKIWYTEHFVSAVGSFDPSTHVVRDYETPTANTQPYGIAADGQKVWFTENNSSVDQVAVLNTSTGAISEYPIVRPLANSTPHLIVVDPSGHPWWTEGWSNTIATLNPAAATPGKCGTTSGTCNGISRFQLPTSTTCGTSTHVSGIAFQRSTGLVWLDNSLTNQVGSFDRATSTFKMYTVSCGAHPHDGLNVDPGGNVWFDEEFANALGEVVSSGNSSGHVSVTVSPSRPVSGSPTSFTASDTDPSGIASVQWTFGDGASATGNPVTHTYATSGTETLTVVVTDNDGNQDRLTKSIWVASSTGPITLASDSFDRTVSNGWGTADQGGAWTLLDGSSGWSVTPAIGNVNVAPGGEQRAILTAVSVQDVNLLAKIVLPRCNDAVTNCDAYLLGRVSGGSSPTYYRVGVVQGQGRNNVFVRAQLSNGGFLANDADTGIPAAAGVTVWLRVVFQGINPTTIRARAWLAGTTEPSSWQLTATDSTSAEQAPGAVGVRVRNEDASAGHTFGYERFLAHTLG